MNPFPQAFTFSALFFLVCLYLLYLPLMAVLVKREELSVKTRYALSSQMIYYNELTLKISVVRLI